jgi:flagellar assembly protein FliH
MSSSKVIKSGDVVLEIGGFSFQNMLKKDFFANAKTAEQAEDFTPMALFDTSELGDRRKYIATPQVVEAEEPLPLPPPGTFVTDEDLQRYQEESYQRGLQDGKNLAERGLLNVFKGLRTAAGELQLLRERVLRDSEDDLLALSLAITRKVIVREVSQDRQTVLRLIRTSLQNLNERDKLTIRIHPDDHALLTTSQNEALQSELASITFTLKPDPAIEVGSCQIETERGTVDAGFEAQLEEVYRRLLEERAETYSAPEPAE